jgi:hypothetical protein
MADATVVRISAVRVSPPFGWAARLASTPLRS